MVWCTGGHAFHSRQGHTCTGRCRLLTSACLTTHSSPHCNEREGRRRESRGGGGAGERRFHVLLTCTAPSRRPSGGPSRSRTCRRDRESGPSMHWGSSIQRCTQQGASGHRGGLLRKQRPHSCDCGRSSPALRRARRRREAGRRSVHTGRTGCRVHGCSRAVIPRAAEGGRSASASGPTK